MNTHDRYRLSAYLMLHNGHSTTCSTIYTSHDAMVAGVSVILDTLTRETTTDWLIIGTGMTVASEIISVNFRIEYQDLVQNGSSSWVAYDESDVYSILQEAHALLGNVGKDN